MLEDRPRYGPLIAAVGSGLLAWSVFLPWYAVTLTARGVALMQGYLSRFAAEYGNASLQAKLASMHSEVGTAVGHEFATVSAHQVLHTLNVVLLVVAGLCLVLSLARLAGQELPLQGSSATAALGLLALLCVLYRMGVRPEADNDVFALSLRGGIWLALGSSVAIVVGALWPRSLSNRSAHDAHETALMASVAPARSGTAPPLEVAQVPPQAPAGGPMVAGTAPLGKTVYVARGEVRQDLDGSGWINAAAAARELADEVHVVSVVRTPEAFNVTLTRESAQPPVEGPGPRPTDWRPALVTVT
jgi:hypothetical protein